MDKLFPIISDLSNLLIRLNTSNSDKSEIAERIKLVINDCLGNPNNYESVRCRRVFISKGGIRTPYGISVVPLLRNGILNEKTLKDFDIDIDLSSFVNDHNDNGFTCDELIAWFMHELISNVLTDITFIRLKNALIKYYDTNNTLIMQVFENIGAILWIGIFTRTKKSYITDSSNDLVSTYLTELGLADNWNSALTKYVDIYGGSYDILSDSYIARMDKTQIYEFNKLARKYSSYTIKYNNTDYQTFAKYLYASTGSELIKAYMENEPQRLIYFKEKDVYTAFNDRKLITEAVTATDLFANTVPPKTDAAIALKAEVNELTLDADNMLAESDKLLVYAKLHDMAIRIADATANDPTNAILHELNDKVNTLIMRVKDADIQTPNVVEL